MPVLIAVVGVLAYANTFTVPFQFDDDVYVSNNPTIRTFRYFIAPSEVKKLSEYSPTSFPPALRSAFTTRILGYLSLAINYHLHGLNVAGYHLLNLVIHILNGILVYLILVATLRADFFSSLPCKGAFDLRSIIASASSLLFVSHPIQTQAVTYISQRFTSLASLFYLLSLLLYIHFRTSVPGRGRPVYHATALVSAVAAMLTKEFTFTLPIIIAFYEVTFFSTSRMDRIKTLAPFAITLLIIPVIIFIQQGTLNALDSTMRSMAAADETNISRMHYLLAQPRVIILYIRLLFFPVGQNVDHDMPVYPSLFVGPVFFSSIALIALFCFAVYLYFAADRAKEYPELKVASFGMIWFFITISVESSVIPLGELVAEYRMYLPSVGMIIAVVSLLVYAARRSSMVWPKSPWVLCAVLGAAVISLAIGTHLRNTVWDSEISLWKDAARKSPGKVRPHQNLGTYYLAGGRLEEAKKEFLVALRLDPNNFETHNNLGIVYKRLGDYARAIQEYTTVLKLAPSDAMAHYNLGNLYLAQGNLEEAIREYQASISLAPDYDEAHNNLGIAYEKSGKIDLAIMEFKRAIKLNPENVNARNNLVLCMKKAGMILKK